MEELKATLTDPLKGTGGLGTEEWGKTGHQICEDSRKSHRTSEGLSAQNRALKISMEFWSPLYYNHNKEPPQNSIGKPLYSSESRQPTANRKTNRCAHNAGAPVREPRRKYHKPVVSTSISLGVFAGGWVSSEAWESCEAYC